MISEEFSLLSLALAVDKLQPFLRDSNDKYLGHDKDFDKVMLHEHAGTEKVKA